MERRKSELSVRVTPVDDHVLVREDLRLLLEPIPGVDVVAEASALHRGAAKWIG